MPRKRKIREWQVGNRVVVSDDSCYDGEAGMVLEIVEQDLIVVELDCMDTWICANDELRRERSDENI